MSGDSASAQLLFEQVDAILNQAAQTIRNRVFSEYRDLPWTPDQRKTLQPLVRNELDHLIWAMLARLDNVGCTKLEGVPNWSIHDSENGDIRQDHADYSDMWLTYLSSKR